MPLLLMLWCNVVKRNWTIILMQTVYYCYGKIIKTYRNINKLMANLDFSRLAYGFLLNTTYLSIGIHQCHTLNSFGLFLVNIGITQQF